MVSNQTKGQSKMPELVAVVTGASQGIGRGTALRLAKDFSGLVLAARNGEALQEVATEVKSSGADPLAFALDLSMRASAETLIKGTLDRFGRIDALLNIAGAVPQIDLFEMTDEQWRAGLGGALIPGLMSLYLFVRHHLWVRGPRVAGVRSSDYKRARGSATFVAACRSVSLHRREHRHSCRSGSSESQ
jgi:NAD(P)-dependent dehydrogenase (short-subunit alcohol dehydrogenase family)